MNTFHETQVNRIDGVPVGLDSYAGQVALVVNVASQCGLTPQYEGLVRLHQRFRERGFTVLAFPANEFGAQEPGTSEDIQLFCSTRFGVDFPLFEKIVVKGPEQHPLYRHLTKEQPQADNGGDDTLRERLENAGLGGGEPHEILWNFEKFLVDREGRIVSRFAPNVTPEDERVITAIEALL
ncbi:MAG: glutathione peroxidase [Cyanobacteria bacterium RYN_339]|nr:glutathione peroxidase [Cyanobacteria bacterium RYN_339]